MTCYPYQNPQVGQIWFFHNGWSVFDGKEWVPINEHQAREHMESTNNSPEKAYDRAMRGL